MSFDLKIINGSVIDGTGAERRDVNIGIRDGFIVEVGKCESPADEVIDAAGAIVTPGFVDIHTHYDGQVAWDDELAPSVYHGVTTAVVGSCGVGFAPVREGDRQKLIDLMVGVEDIPETALAEGIPWNWETFPEYMDAIDFPHTMDFAVHVPHDALRVYVMGERALAEELATDEDIERMRELTREALDAGAIGFSTGRTDNHRNVDGGATPASEATVRELEGIAAAFHGLEHGVLQAVSDFDMADSPKRFDAEFDVLERMAAASHGHPMSISLLQRNMATDQWRQILERCEQADDKGLEIRTQVAARGIGVLLGLEATFHPFIGFPSFKKISQLPLDEQVAAMRDDDFKRQLLTEESDSVAGDGSNIPPIADIFLKNLDFVAMRLYKLGEGFDYEPDPMSSVLAEAYARDVSPLEVIYDAMLEDDGHALLYFPIYNYLEQNLDVVHEMISHPLSMPGLSDGGAHVGTICDASFPTYWLAHWTRDRKRGETGKFKTEEVVKWMTQDTARFIGFHDRGVIRVGMRADINVIDYDKLQLHLPHLVHDLPAGGKRFLQAATGYRATICAGEVVVRDDQLTEARPGRLVRLTG